MRDEKRAKPGIVVSRCDRLGDLVLSLPALGLLRQAGFAALTLHCSPYARAVGEWARFNGLADQIWTAGDAPPLSVEFRDSAFLSLHHSEATRAASRAFGFSLGPRTKLSTLWTYTKTLSQKRSHVEKSEMEYNLDLAAALLAHLKRPIPEFQGLPSLRVPPEWRSPRPSPDLIAVVSNRGSAANWPLEAYIAHAEIALNEGRRVDFLVSGTDAAERTTELKRRGVEKLGASIVGDLASIEELIAYLAGAREVLSSSTGPLHLAHAAGVAVTGVYPRKRVESFDRWRPHGYWHGAPVRYLEIANLK